MRRLKIFFAAGPGDVIQAHRHWMNGEPDPSQMSLTHSGEFADFCRQSGADGYIVSSFGQKQIFRDAEFVIEHRPKPQSRGGIWYHLSEIRYGIGLFITALRHRAQVAVLQSGSTHNFVMSLFRLAGMQVIPVMHNTLWPCGSPPTGAIRRIIALLDRSFFRFAATAVIAVSPECLRQVDQFTGGKHCPLYEMKVQFRREYFATIPAVPPHDQQPFRIMFVGRINENKGVFDVLHIASAIQDRAPGRVAWEICGTGPDLDELRKRQREMKLESIVTIHGWTPPTEMKQVIARSHLAIVPTRSDFAEGLAATVIEPVLAGRPVITNPVVPALEVVKPACIEARANDVESCVSAVLNVLGDGNHYRELCNSCPALAEQFYDRRLGFQAVLQAVIGNRYTIAERPRAIGRRKSPDLSSIPPGRAT
jgi:glycosyltransferase involved in cell wall biosynthesis